MADSRFTLELDDMPDDLRDRIGDIASKSGARAITDLALALARTPERFGDAEFYLTGRVPRNPDPGAGH